MRIFLSATIRPVFRHRALYTFLSTNVSKPWEGTGGGRGMIPIGALAHLGEPFILHVDRIHFPTKK